MARTRFIDYRAEDSTELLNNQYRGVLEQGVYLGFNVSTGTSGGWWLAFTHDADPDNTGEVLGALITKDGVTIQENEDQDNVVAGGAPGGSDEIHWVVASYTYNKALPNNDVVYTVKTAVAPSTPALTDDEILLAEIDVPTGSASYGAAGVDIKTVGKKSLYGISAYELFGYFDSILDPGIYDGMIASQGTTTLQVSISAGVWITQENARIIEAAQSNVFTITNPGNDFYSYAWIVGMHKNEDLDPAPSVDYLLVEGTAVAIGTQAALPDNTAILAAAAAVDAKYDDASYINKLGYIRTENQSGTYVISYIRGETVLEQESVIVYGAEDDSLSRSGKYYGDEGLRQAIDDIYTISKDRSDIENQKYTVLLDGVFKLDDTYLTLPSNIVLRGYGAPAKIESDEGSDGVIRITGFEAIYDNSNDTVAQTTWGAGSPPSGYVARNFDVQATYRVGEDLVARKFSVGDPIVVVEPGAGGGPATYLGTFQGYDTGSNNWTIQLYIEELYNTNGNSQEIELTIKKRNLGLIDVDVDRKTSAGTGALVINHVEESVFDNVKVRNLDLDNITLSRFGFLEVENDVTQWEECTYNTYEHLKLRCPQATLTVGSADEEYSTFGVIEVNVGSTVQTLTIQSAGACTYKSITMIGGTASSIAFDVAFSTVDFVYLEASSAVVTTTGARTTFGLVNTSSSFVFDASASLQTVDILVSPGAYTNSGAASNKVLNVPNASYQGFLDHANSDRNLKIVSDANLTWDLTTTTLTWDDVIRFDIPWTAGYSEIAAGSASLSSDGMRLYIDIDRSATGVAAASTTTLAKASASNNEYYQDRVFVAVRYSNTVYLFDGTRIEDTQTVQIGSTPPPDSSVTYSKLGDSATAFHNEFFRDYVSVDGDADWPSEVVILNSDLRTMTYTVSTGVLQYSAAIDLSDVQVGDMVILSNSDLDAADCWTREEIYAVDDGSNNITISTGLNSLVTGAATIWNGAVVRGDLIVSNHSLSTTSYDETNGRVTFVPGLDFSQYQVKAGFVFVDNNYKKYLIQARDTSGDGDWVDIGIGRRDVGVGTPTDVLQGSIRVNNNPHNIRTADLKVSTGMEFIPIDWFGHRSEVDNEDIESFSQVGAPSEAVQWLYPEPMDNRVRVRTQWIARSRQQQAGGHDSSGAIDQTSIQTMAQDFMAVDVTATCTGAALVVEHLGDASSAVPVYVDGEILTIYARFSGSEGCDVTYGPMRHFHANLIRQHFTPRMPLGVHNIQWTIPDTFSGTVNPVAVRGVLLFTAPGGDDENVVHAPGTLVRRGGVVEFTEPEIAALPSSTEDWDKGGRTVRYISSTNTYNWASEWVRGFTSTGTTASGPSILDVTSPTSWRVGDLMMLVNGTSRSIHVVTAIAGTTFTIAPDAPFTQVGATLYYYGHVPYDEVNDYHDRPQEEVAAQMNLAEFACGGDAGDHRGAAVYAFNDVRTGSLGVRLSDLVTTLEGSAGFSNTSADDNTDFYPFDWLVWPNNGTLRIRFIGTGLSLNVVGTTNLGIRIDGVTVDLAVLQSSSTRINDRIGGTYIVGELPYGFHIADLVDTSGAADQRVQKITIFQPKKPTLPADAFELLDTNIRSVTDNELSLAVIDDNEDINLGNINYDPGAVVRLEATESLADAPRVFPAGIGAKQWDWSSSGAPSGSQYDFAFMGKEFVMMWGSLSLGGASPVDIRVRDHDGEFVAPSAATGFTVTGVDSISSTTSTYQRNKWTFSQGGHHIISIRAGNVGDDVNMYGVEWAPRLHNYRSKKPYGFEHFMPFQHCGLDVRNMTPIPQHLLPLPEFSHIQHFTQNTAIDMEEQAPFFFYCPGGLMELHVEGLVNHVGAAIAWRIEVDGGRFDDFEDIQTSFDSSSTGGPGVSAHRHIFLQPGFHWAIFRIDSASAGELTHTLWTAKYIPSGHPNYLSNRGILPASNASGIKTEKFY